MLDHKPKPFTCPCGAGPAYTACCGRWHSGPLHLQAPDALSLMRSRYCAYVLNLGDYLLATWHPDTRPALLAPTQGVRWLGLDVRRHERTDAHHATVDFVARSRREGASGGRAERLHETSRFAQCDGRWYYIDGDLHSAA